MRYLVDRIQTFGSNVQEVVTPICLQSAIIHFMSMSKLKDNDILGNLLVESVGMAKGDIRK